MWQRQGIQRDGAADLAAMREGSSSHAPWQACSDLRCGLHSSIWPTQFNNRVRRQPASYAIVHEFGNLLQAPVSCHNCWPEMVRPPIEHFKCAPTLKIGQ